MYVRVPLHLSYIHLHACVCAVFFSSTHKIVGVATLSRKDHTTAQTREAECTKIFLPQVISRGIYMYIHYCVIEYVHVVYICT